MRVNVTYLRERPSGLALVREGEGRDLAAAVAAADHQLPSGYWRRVCVSTQSSIRRSAQAEPARRSSPAEARYERQLVQVRITVKVAPAPRRQGDGPTPPAAARRPPGR